jgi:hypothetical protein
VGEGAALLGWAAGAADGGAADGGAAACVVGVEAAFGALCTVLWVALGLAEAVTVGLAEVGVVVGFTVV